MPPTSRLSACGPAHVELFSVFGSVDGGFDVVMIEVVEDRIFVVDLEHDGTWPAQPCRYEVQFLVAPRFDAKACSTQPRHAPTPDVFLHPHLLAEVAEVGNQDDDRESADPPRLGGDHHGQGRSHDGRQDQSENSSLAECVALGAGDGVGLGIEPAATSADGRRGLARFLRAFGVSLGNGDAFARGVVFERLGPVFGVAVHQVLRIGACSFVSICRLRAPRAPVRIAVVSRRRAAIGPPLRAPAMQDARGQRCIGGLSNSGMPVGKHGKEHEEPQHHQPDPQERVRHCA